MIRLGEAGIIVMTNEPIGADKAARPSNPPALALRSLLFSYDVNNGIEDVTMTVKDREFLSILGPTPADMISIVERH